MTMDQPKALCGDGLIAMVSGWTIIAFSNGFRLEPLLQPHPLSNQNASWDGVFFQAPWQSVLWSRGSPLPLFLPPHPQVNRVLGSTGPPPALLAGNARGWILGWRQLLFQLSAV